MAQLFISHSSTDSALALMVRERLADLGYESVFLDVSATGGLVAGAAWRDQLFTNLDRCQAVVLVGTAASNASLWCHSELALARWLRKPVLALLVDGSEPHELVADLQGVKVTSGDVSSEVLRAGLAALGLEQEEAWDPARSPFPGLQPLDESYAPVFFGREQQLEELRQLVDPPSRLRQGVVLPVLGPSGSGKSSLVRAGLVASLRSAPDWVVSDPWTPSDAPLSELGMALSHAAKRFDVGIDTEECRDLVGAPGGMAEFVRRLRAGGELSAATRVMVVIDQAEELVTVTGEAERSALLAALATGVEAPSPLRVVMTARTDLWDEVSAAALRAGLAVAPTVLHVPPLSRSDLARVIAEPARRADLTLEDGLLERLVEDTGTGDALPLLAFTLSRMTALAEGRVLTHAGYDALGGVRGAIASRASAVARGTRTEAEVAAAVLQLVGTGEGHPAARLARTESVPAAQRAILDDLVEARLVVVREQGEHQVYAPAHEALFSAWPPLTETLAAREDDLRQRSRLERRTSDWRDAGSGLSGLLSGAELDAAQAWQERSPDLVGPDVADYVTASTARQRRSTIVRAVVAASVAALAVALVAVLLVNAAGDRRQAREARVRELRAVAELEQQRDPVASAVALLAGLELDPGSDELADAADDLLAAPMRDVLQGGGLFPATGTTVGSRVAVATTTVQGPAVLDLATGATLRSLPEAGHPVAVRPDDRVAVISSPNGLTWWDLTDDGDEPLARSGMAAAIGGYSPDGTLMVSSAGTVVTLWNVADPTSPGMIESWVADADVVHAVAVTDGGRVYTSGSESLLSAWTPLEPAPPTPVVPTPPSGLTPNHLWLDAARERALVSSTSVGNVGVSAYSLETGDVVGTYLPQLGGDLDQKALATWTAAMDAGDGRVAVFDAAGKGFVFTADDPGRPVARLEGHTGLVNQAAFTPDGLLVTGALDGSVRVWNTRAPGARAAGDASPTEALCEEFGDRIDGASVQRALGDDDFDNPCPGPEAAPSEASLTLTTAAPQGTEVAAVARDDFEDQYSLFGDATVRLEDGTASERRLVDGTLRTFRDGAQVLDVWHDTALSRTLAAAEISLRVASPTRSSCGLTVTDGVHRINVMLDPSSGAGAVTAFTDDTDGEQLDPFAAGRGPGGRLPWRDLSVALDAGELVVTVDGAEVDRRRTAVTATSVAGVVSEGSSTDCRFDDFAVAG